MKEFLYQVLSDYEEVYSDFIREPSADIKQAEIDNEILKFDLHSLEKLRKAVKSFDESDDEFTENEFEFLESDNNTEIFEESVSSASKNNSILTHCVVIDNDNDQKIIRRCKNSGIRNLSQLAGI